MSDISFYWSYARMGGITREQWQDEMAEMLTRYLNKEPIYVKFLDEKRQGSVGRFYIDNVQALLGGPSPYGHYGYRYGEKPKLVEEKPENINREIFGAIHPTGKVRWDGRSNCVNVWGSEIHWLKDHKEGTLWAYGKPKKQVPTVQDKLGRDIKVGDFISYILYHFDNGRSAAGIYYGKVTKIDQEGQVHAKNIKLRAEDRSEDKRIKDPSLIVIMTKDLMDQLMMARLAIL